MLHSFLLTGIDQHNASVELFKGSLQQELDALKAFYLEQPEGVKNALREQAMVLAEAITKNRWKVAFSLPAQILCHFGDPVKDKTCELPLRYRCQQVINLCGWFRQIDLLTLLSRKLTRLELDRLQPVSLCGSLIRYLTASCMVDGLVPERQVLAEPGSPPVRPFDENDRLIVPAIEDAESYLTKLHGYFKVLESAARLSPCLMADKNYQDKRWEVVEHIEKQGQAFARYQTLQVIQIIRARAERDDLNRGFGVSLPYLDDISMQIKRLNFKVVPPGRIRFQPTFVVEAARKEQLVVAQDVRMSFATRKRLIDNLQLLEKSFDFGGKFHPVGMLFHESIGDFRLHNNKGTVSPRIFIGK